MKGRITTYLTVCPIRAKPDDKSELVSQILFGECAEVIDKHKGDWIKVRMEYDAYEGWTDKKLFIPATDSMPGPPALSLDLFQNVFSDDASTWITIGAELPRFDGMTTYIEGRKFRFSGQAVFPDQMNPDSESIEKIARKMINVPYLWGGRTPAGVDCSGFTQLVFKCVGIKLNRDSGQQAMQGSSVDFVSTAQTGDLAFFTKETEQISHVGIVLSDGNIIHASGKVRIDSIDHYGIFNRDIQEYTHRLRIIKRYL